MAKVTIPKLPIRTIIITLVLLYLASGVIAIVDAGTVGVIKQFGRVSGRVLSPGIHFVMPIVDQVVILPTKKVTYETSPQEKHHGSNANYLDFPVDTNTQDGQPVDISYTIRFSVDPIKADWIVQNIGTESDLVEKIVTAESRVWVRNIPRNYKAEAIYTGVGSVEIQNAIFDAINDTFAENGLILDFVGVREITFDPAYVSAIKDKQEEEVKIETEKNRAEQEKFRKEQRITAAEASAKEQELQRETLSAQVLEKLWLEKWDGKLPEIMLGNDATPLLQLPR